ncbi:hypothetical protein [Agrococcus sp. ProA11]|uniref:hypothetical protein n=1 Tax=Agrococcus chionoecetis TaxID=3153752 RepID=UPI003260180D
MQEEIEAPALAYTESDIAAVLADLQHEVSGSTSLHAWQQNTGVPIQRVVSGADIAYVHLGAHDRFGTQIVLMLRDGSWRRAM